MKDVETLRQDNIAYNKLSESGYKPQGWILKTNNICVLKVENENRNNELKKIYYFNSYTEAAKELLKV